MAAVDLHRAGRYPQRVSRRVGGMPAQDQLDDFGLARAELIGREKRQPRSDIRIDFGVLPVSARTPLPQDGSAGERINGLQCRRVGLGKGARRNRRASDRVIQPSAAFGIRRAISSLMRVRR